MTTSNGSPELISFGGTVADAEQLIRQLNALLARAAVGTFDSLTVSGSLSANGGISTTTLTTSGNVGVGTAPNVALDVFSAASGIVNVRGGGAANQGGAFYVTSSSNTQTLAAFGDYARINGGAVDTNAAIYTAASVPLVFLIGGGDKGRFAANGHLLLNTPTDNGVDVIQAAGSISSTGGYTNVAPANTNSTVTLTGSGAYSSIINLSGGGGGSGVVQSVGASLIFNVPTGQHVYAQINGTTVTDVASTGLSVTGSVTSSTTIKTGGYTVASLNSLFPPGVAGRRAYVTDATAPTFLGTLTGGGTVVCPVFDNGTAWVAG